MQDHEHAPLDCRELRRRFAALLIACGPGDEADPWPYGTGGDAAPTDDAAEASVDGGAEPDAHAEAGEDVSPTDAVVEPFVELLSPAENQNVPNPVTFQFAAGGGVETVWFVVDDYPLQSEPIPASAGSYTYTFSGVNMPRTVVLQGRDASDATIAEDQVTFVPTSCMLADQPGFNHHTIQVINDGIAYPKNGSYPYCWEAQGDTCNAHWGIVHDAYYDGNVLFEGGGDCFCSGHTLELFLRAYRAWQQDNGVSETVPYEVDGNQLFAGDIDPYGSNGGAFYQYWQGFGVTSEASAGQAFETFGIGTTISEAEWDQVLPGDFVNLSRSTGSGHAVIFVSWIVEGGARVGLRYYGCNGSGDSCPDPDDPLNTQSNSGPSFLTERFSGHGGTVLPQYLFIGRAFVPNGGT